MPTVLVVDDSDVDRLLAGSRVEKMLGATVVYATNGEEALEQISVHRPDVVITDLQMPKVNGLELTSAIKSEYPRIPVILITSKGSEDIATEALRIGAASYVPKRRLDDLPNTVSRILIAASQDRAHSRLMHYLSQTDAVFTFHNDLSLIQALVAHVQELLRCLPLGDETERLRVGIALEEALKNAYYHGNLEVGRSVAGFDRQAYAKLAEARRYETPYCERRIHVRAQICREHATFTVRDEGPGFDPSALPGAADAETHDAPIGKGIVLMRVIMDEVAFNGKGSEVTLVKRRVEEPVGAAGIVGSELD
ncbi:MAG: response regulator [Pirellulales bacterium]